jgi:monovalent cation:H+ antiporter-2, CPA2 family
MIKDESSILILGVAIIEDIIVISMLAILQSVGSTGGLFISPYIIKFGWKFTEKYVDKDQKVD